MSKSGSSRSPASRPNAGTLRTSPRPIMSFEYRKKPYTSDLIASLSMRTTRRHRCTSASCSARVRVCHGPSDKVMPDNLPRSARRTSEKVQGLMLWFHFRKPAISQNAGQSDLVSFAETNKTCFSETAKRREGGNQGNKQATWAGGDTMATTTMPKGVVFFSWRGPSASTSNSVPSCFF